MRLSVGIFAFVLSCATPIVWAFDNGSVVDSTPVLETALLVPMVRCFNCTATQMYNVARAQRQGYTYVYDLSHRTVQKYQVTADTSCRPASGGAGKGRTTTSGCGTSNIVTLTPPVDAFVQQAFNQMLVIYDEAPQVMLNAAARFRIPIEKFGKDNSHNDNRDFDPRDVAWDNPQGSYHSFMRNLTDALADKQSAADVDKAMSDFLYGMHPFLNNFTITTGTGGQSASIQFDKGWSHADIEACTASDCIDLAVDVSPSGQTTITYNGAWDCCDHMYPSPILNVPPGPSWNFHDGASEAHFADYLGTHGIFVSPPQTCQNITITCAHRNSTGYNECRADCS